MVDDKILKFILGIIFIVLLVIFIVLSFKFMGKQKVSSLEELSIRSPVVAGSFYSADKNILSKQINEFLLQSKEIQIEGTPRILIVPHAGYAFSGKVAADAFKLLEGKDFKTVILIGPSHTDWFMGSSVDLHDAWQTPLGNVDVDTDLAKKIISEHKSIFNRPKSHEKEHCLEVCLPFLQKTLKDFKIVPIIVGQPYKQNREALACALSKYLDDRTLIIISSDLSHYPSYEIANQVDKKTVQAILTGELEQFDKAVAESMAQGLPGLDTCACGGEPIKVGLLLARHLGLNQVNLLEYANSGDITSDFSRVVGYAAIVFSKSQQNSTEKDLFSKALTKEDKQTLLKIARQSIEGYLKNKEFPEFKNISPRLNQPQGAFVTLRENHQLRGCVGRVIEKEKPLYQVVSQMAVLSAIDDNRFLPVSLGEMKDIDIEISVLSPLKKIKNPIQEIEIGKHGVVVEQGLRSGVFLPQVATENNWGLDEFMSQLCQQKAGLSKDAWKTGEIDIYIFSAEIFNE